MGRKAQGSFHEQILLTWDLRNGLGSPGKEGGEKVAGGRAWWPNWSRTSSGSCAGFEETQCQELYGDKHGVLPFSST